MLRKLVEALPARYPGIREEYAVSAFIPEAWNSSRDSPSLGQISLSEFGTGWNDDEATVEAVKMAGRQAAEEPDKHDKLKGFACCECGSFCLLGRLSAKKHCGNVEMPTLHAGPVFFGKSGLQVDTRSFEGHTDVDRLVQGCYIDSVSLEGLATSQVYMHEAPSKAGERTTCPLA